MSLQRTDEWFKQRKNRITGSIAGACLGISKFKKPKDVMRDLVRAYHGLPSEFQGNFATEYGKATEEGAVYMYEMETGNETRECGFFEYEEWLGASPDRIISNGGVLEIKCPYGKFGTAEFSEILPEYYAQVQIEMLCANAEWCDFIQWSPQGYEIQTILKDHKWLHHNLPRLLEFWEQLQIELHNPAHLEDKHVMKDELLALAEEYDRLGTIMKETEKQRKELLGQIVEKCEGKDSKIGAYKLTQVEREGSVNYKAIIEEHCPTVKVDEYRGEKTKYWRLS